MVSIRRLAAEAIEGGLVVVFRGPSFTGGAGLFSLALLLHPAPAGAAQYGDTILIVPFEDHSYFRGTWDIRQGIPRQLS